MQDDVVTASESPSEHFIRASVRTRGRMARAGAMLRLSRPSKRNALSSALICALRQRPDNFPPSAKAAVIHGQSDHFCTGLDLSELKVCAARQG